LATASKPKARRRRGSEKEAEMIAEILGIPKPVLMGGGVYCSLARIKPSHAKQWIDYNHYNNRRLNKQRVQALARDIHAGNWKLNHQGIAFDHDLNVIDGQHRLAAIIEANKMIETFVFFNLPDDVFLTLDSGKSRSFVDAMKTSGNAISTNRAAMLRRMLTGSKHGGSYRLTNQELFDLHDEFSEALDFVESRTSAGVRRGVPRGLRCSPVLAAFAVAYYHVPNKDLERMIEGYMTGVVTNKKDQAAAALRTMALSDSTGYYQGETSASEKFMKAQNAIFSFMKGKQIKQLKAIKEPYYKLPDFDIEEYRCRQKNLKMDNK